LHGFRPRPNFGVLLLRALVAGLTAGPAARLQLTTIWNFQGGTADGAYPGGFTGPAFAIGAGGALFTTTTGGGNFADQGAVVRLTPPKPPAKAWSEQVIFAFSGDIYAPTRVVVDAKGALYGTAYRLVEPATRESPWTETVLHSFAGDKDGCLPIGGLTLGSDGDFYGSTLDGGGWPACGSSDGVSTGCGTLYAIAPQPRRDRGKRR
jgi:hypothetical protein